MLFLNRNRNRIVSRFRVCYLLNRYLHSLWGTSVCVDFAEQIIPLLRLQRVCVDFAEQIISLLRLQRVCVDFAEQIIPLLR